MAMIVVLTGTPTALWRHGWTIALVVSFINDGHLYRAIIPEKVRYEIFGDKIEDHQARKEDDHQLKSKEETIHGLPRRLDVLGALLKVMWHHSNIARRLEETLESLLHIWKRDGQDSADKLSHPASEIHHQ